MVIPDPIQPSIACPPHRGARRRPPGIEPDAPVHRAQDPREGSLTWPARLPQRRAEFTTSTPAAMTPLAAQTQSE
jgi:hypothetical protein